MRITRTDRTASFRVNLDAAILDRFQAALQAAQQAGLRVDYRPDIEALLARLTRKLQDAAAESAQPSVGTAGVTSQRESQEALDGSGSGSC